MPSGSFDRLRVSMPAPSSRRPDLTAIVVTHENAEIVERCLAAIRAGAVRHSLEIIVVDNASTDGTPELAKHAAPEALVVALAANIGFAAANNVGRERATGRLLALVNSDCFPDPGSLDLLVDAVDARPTAGLIGGRLHFGDGRHQSSGGQLPTLLSVLWLAVGLHRLPLTERLGVGILASSRLYERPRAVGWVSGAFCVARPEIGPLPESAFMYGEDVTWGAQAVDRGFHAWIEPSATAVHLGGASVARAGKAGFMEERSVEALIRWFASRSPLQALTVRVILCLHALLRLVGASILVPLKPRFALRAIRRFWVMLRAALLGRPRRRRSL